MNLNRFFPYALLLLAILLLSWAPIELGQGTGYVIRGWRVYYFENGGGYQHVAIGRLLSEAEARTFQIDQPFGYAMDAHHVYYAGKLIPHAETATFERLDCGYARDPRYVYSHQNVLDGAKVASFEIIGGCFARDDEHVYLGGIVVNGAQPNSFELLVHAGPYTGIYSRDEGHAYRWGEVIEGADPASFQVLGNTGCDHQGEYYTRDRQHVYYYGQPIPDVDAATFQMLGGCGYARDAQRVYYEFRVLEGADPETFQASDDGQARDKNNCYISGHVLDPEDCD